MIEFVINSVSFIFVIGVIVLVHEFGHFIIARLFGVGVERFSIGFGRPIVKWKRGSTVYAIGWLPLGGYVQLEGEEESIPSPTSFRSQPKWKQILIYLAGPAMNFILAVALIWISFVFGVMSPFVTSISTEVGWVEPESPAARAGIVPGDKIVEINAVKVKKWRDFLAVLLSSTDPDLIVKVERDGKIEDLRIKAKIISEDGYKIRYLGVFPKIIPVVKKVMEGYPAQKAGLLEGDKILQVNGVTVFSPSEVVKAVQKSPTRTTVVVQRKGKTFEFKMVPRIDNGIPRIGIVIGIVTKMRPMEALFESIKFNLFIVKSTVEALSRVVTGYSEIEDSIQGPIGIASLSGEAAKQGISSLIYFIALVSVSIGILNLLPIPVLDGGQIMILLVEIVTRRELSDNFKKVLQLLGITAIVMIMVFAFHADIKRLVGKNSQDTPITDNE